VRGWPTHRRLDRGEATSDGASPDNVSAHRYHPLSRAACPGPISQSWLRDRWWPNRRTPRDSKQKITVGESFCAFSNAESPLPTVCGPRLAAAARLSQELTCAPAALAARAHARWLQRQGQHNQRFQVVPQHGGSSAYAGPSRTPLRVFDHVAVTSAGGWLPFGNEGCRPIDD
jgi:hypothetical protein